MWCTEVAAGALQTFSSVVSGDIGDHGRSSIRASCGEQYDARPCFKAVFAGFDLLGYAHGCCHSWFGLSIRIAWIRNWRRHLCRTLDACVL